MQYDFIPIILTELLSPTLSLWLSSLVEVFSALRWCSWSISSSLSKRTLSTDTWSWAFRSLTCLWWRQNSNKDQTRQQPLSITMQEKTWMCEPQADNGCSNSYAIPHYSTRIMKTVQMGVKFTHSLRSWTSSSRWPLAAASLEWRRHQSLELDMAWANWDSFEQNKHLNLEVLEQQLASSLKVRIQLFCWFILLSRCFKMYLWWIAEWTSAAGQRFACTSFEPDLPEAKSSDRTVQPMKILICMQCETRRRLLVLLSKTGLCSEKRCLCVPVCVSQCEEEPSLLLLMLIFCDVTNTAGVLDADLLLQFSRELSGGVLGPLGLLGQQGERLSVVPPPHFILLRLLLLHSLQLLPLGLQLLLLLYVALLYPLHHIIKQFFWSHQTVWKALTCCTDKKKELGGAEKTSCLCLVENRPHRT